MSPLADYLLKVGIAISFTLWVILKGSFLIFEIPWDLVTTFLVMSEIIGLAIVLYYIVWKTNKTFIDVDVMTL